MEIKKAAIRIRNKIFTGFDHGECFNQIPQELRNQSIEQGFVTDSNEFVDRKEAMIIARQANQIAYDDGEKKTLISEDLHLNWLNKMNKELEELRQNAIIPNFNIGDYFIEYWDTEPSIYQYKGNNHFECLNKVQGYHCDYIILGALLLGEDFIKRISKEEAKSKLKGY